MSFLDAYRDLKYLLNRGYPKRSALKFVADHYRLPSRERYLLARCVFPDEWIMEVEQKRLNAEELSGETLGVDGFNVLITLESILEGEAILCEDGIVRDIKYQKTYRMNEGTERLIERTIEVLGTLKVGRVVFFYGRNTPMSGVVRGITETALEKFNVPGEVLLVKSPDFELKRFKTVATGDSAIIKKAERFFDLAAEVGKAFGKTPNSFINSILKLNMSNGQKLQAKLEL